MSRLLRDTQRFGGWMKGKAMFHSKCKRTIADLESQIRDLQKCIEEVRSSEGASAESHASALAEKDAVLASKDASLAKRDATIGRMKRALMDIAALASSDDSGRAVLSVASGVVPDCVNAAQLPPVNIAIAIEVNSSINSFLASQLISMVSHKMAATLIGPQFTQIETTSRYGTSMSAVRIEARLAGRLETCCSDLQNILRGDFRCIPIVERMHPNPLTVQMRVGLR